MDQHDEHEQVSDGEYYSKAITILIFVLASLVGIVLLVFRGTGTLR